MLGSVRELREIREFRELWYTRYFRNSQLVVPAILSEASAEDTHPPPRRGLGGGSGLQLSAEQAGVEVVSRGIGVFTLLNLHYNFRTK